MAGRGITRFKRQMQNLLKEGNAKIPRISVINDKPPGTNRLKATSG